MATIKRTRLVAPEPAAARSDLGLSGRAVRFINCAPRTLPALNGRHLVGAMTSRNWRGAWAAMTWPIRIGFTFGGSHIALFLQRKRSSAGPASIESPRELRLPRTQSLHSKGGQSNTSTSRFSVEGRVTSLDVLNDVAIIEPGQRSQQVDIDTNLEDANRAIGKGHLEEAVVPAAQGCTAA